MDFKECEYIFNRGSKKNTKCSAKTLNQYCKKHSKTKNVLNKVTEIPINDGKEEIKIQEVNEESKKKVPV